MSSWAYSLHSKKISFKHLKNVNQTDVWISKCDILWKTHSGCVSCCRTAKPLVLTAMHCNTLAAHLQLTATYCSTLQHTTTHCSTLQHTATHCSTLQHIAMHVHHQPAISKCACLRLRYPRRTAPMPFLPLMRHSS